MSIQLTEGIIEMVKADLDITVSASWAMEPYLESGQLLPTRLTNKGLHRNL